eukprot:m.161903 g.161903  ORF g.161903 m.161903 type:complete len:282 (-) comp15201_c3_seq8:3277-4122(-)
MVLVHEYRIPMPLSVAEYKTAQLYMIARHSNGSTSKSEGVRVLKNEPYTDPVHGEGQYTEKHIMLGSSLPSWVRAAIPSFFHVTEKAWNYFPYTITEYTCPFLPRFSIKIQTRYEDNPGNNEKALEGLGVDKAGELLPRTVVWIDIAKDEIPEKHKHDTPDLKTWHSDKTGRGPLVDGWQAASQPVMCSYKLVEASFEVWGFQTKVEAFVQHVVRDILLVGHAQAVGWLDDWFGMSLEDVRRFEAEQQAEANSRLGHGGAAPAAAAAASIEEKLEQTKLAD